MSARVRTRVSPLVEGAKRVHSWYWANSEPPFIQDGPYTTPYAASVYNESYEQMSDITGDSRKWNRCDHVQRLTRDRGGSLTYYTPNGSYTKMTYSKGCYCNLLESAPFADGGKVAQAHYDALKAFGGELAPQVLGPNFLYELPELRRTAKQIFKKRSARDFRKDLSSDFLGWNFGIKPLIHDLRTLTRLLKGVDQRIQWHKDNSGKPVRVHFQADVTPADAITSVPSPTAGSWSFHNHVNEMKMTYRASALVIFDFPQRSLLEDRVRYLGDVMGFTRPLSVLWEATPYSFVVDWVYDVSDLAERFSLNSWDVKYRILKAGYSVSTIFGTEGRVYGGHPVLNGYNFTVTCDRYEKIYRRRPRIPAGFPFPSPELPGIHELLLGLALYGQKYNRTF